MSSDRELEAWMRDHVRRLPPRRLPDATPEPRPERYWPAPKNPKISPGASILRRHPVLEHLFPEVEEFKIGRSSRSPARGRQCRIPSLKSGDRPRVIRTASTLEKDNVLDHELDADCEQIVEQPIVLEYWHNGRLAKHRPDAFVVYRQGPIEFQEVKYEQDAATTEDRWHSIATALNGLGYSYRVRTEEYIRRQPRYENVRRIYENRFSPLPDKGCLFALCDRLCAHRQMSIDAISRDLALSHGQILH
jgi:hypothetical protein